MEEQFQVNKLKERLKQLGVNAMVVPTLSQNAIPSTTKNTFKYWWV